MSTDRRGDLLIPLFRVFVDAVAIEAAFLASYALRFHTPLFDAFGFVHEGAPPIRSYVFGSLFVIILWGTLFHARQTYRARRNVSLADEFVIVARVISLGMLIVMSAAFFYRAFSFSRIAFALLWIFSILFVFAGRAAVQAFERSQYRRGRHLQKAVIIGNDETGSQIFERLDHHPSFGFSVVGYFGDAPALSPLPLSRAEYLGGVDCAPAFIRDHRIDLGFIALQSGSHPALLELINSCEGINIDFMMVPDILGVLTSQVKLRELEGIPFLKIKSVPFTTWGLISKRAFDVVIAGTLLTLISPLMLFISLAIKFDSRGPVLFKQKRVGLDGREFIMYKFRSMRMGAERLDHQAGLGIRNDPRRTRIGKLLRSTSLDELPQLFNVLQGEMSLVGPRPERTRYVQEFGEMIPKYLDRHRVKTGVTGWAQVNGLRGDTSIEERIRYDLYYIENWSLSFDVKILLRTVRAVLLSKESE